MNAHEQLQKLQEEVHDTNVDISQKESDLLELRQQLVDLGEHECECLDRLSFASVDSMDLGELRQIQDNLEHIKTRVKGREQELQLLHKRLTQIRTLESKWKKIHTASTAANAGESVSDKDKNEPIVVAWRYGPLSTDASRLKQSGVPTEADEAITLTSKTAIPLSTPPPTSAVPVPVPASSYADLLADSIDLCSRSKKKELRKEAKKSEEARREKKNTQFAKSSLSYDEVIAESLHLCSDIVIDDENNKQSGIDIDSSISQQQRSKPQGVGAFDKLLVDNKKERKRAGGMIAGKGQEEEEVERFVRPPRLRIALSNEAASDGFPSSIARSRQWHPDYMQDLPEDGNLSIRAAFDTKYDEYYVFRHWRPSQSP